MVSSPILLGIGVFSKMKTDSSNSGQCSSGNWMGGISGIWISGNGGKVKLVCPKISGIANDWMSDGGITGIVDRFSIE